MFNLTPNLQTSRPFQPPRNLMAILHWQAAAQAFLASKNKKPKKSKPGKVSAKQKVKKWGRIFSWRLLLMGFTSGKHLCRVGALWSPSTKESLDLFYSVFVLSISVAGFSTNLYSWFCDTCSWPDVQWISSLKEFQSAAFKRRLGPYGKRPLCSGAEQSFNHSPKNLSVKAPSSPRPGNESSSRRRIGQKHPERSL